MPRSPLNHPLILTQEFGARPLVYPNTHGHPGIDLASPLGDDWFACVPGFVNVVNRWPWQWGLLRNGDPSYSRYGAAICLDWGGHPGFFVRFLYGHGRNRAKDFDHKHVDEGKYLAESGNTGYTTGPHLHFEMRKYPNDNTGPYYDGLLKRRYYLVDPVSSFLIPFKIPFKKASL